MSVVVGGEMGVVVGGEMGVVVGGESERGKVNECGSW